MSQYKIYEHPIGTKVAVKQGWSWPAFFLGFIWAYSKRMYVLASCFLIITIILIYAIGFTGTGGIIQNVLSLFASTVFGLLGNEWHESNLRTRGYEYLDTVNAESGEGAIANHMRLQITPTKRTEPFF